MEKLTIVVPGISLPATPARTGSSLPKGKLIRYRDLSADLLPANQPAGPAKQVVVCETLAGMTFQEMLADYLGVPANTKFQDLEILADARGLGVVPDQILFALKQTAENLEGNPFGLLLSGWANFWLVKVSNRPGNKFAVAVARWFGGADRWFADAYRLDCANWWNAGFRFSFGQLVGTL